MKRNVLTADPRPTHYDIHITPNFKDFTFEGSVTISLTAKVPTKSITFNACDLVLKSATVGGESYTTFEEDKHNERATVALSKEVQGEFTMSVTYAGTMNDKMKGFYRAKYTVRGETAYMGTTQFEPVDARRAFPCWDEPVHKATFDVTLTVPKELRALANMPEKSRKENDNGTVTVAFDRTPIMSTYLLAWTIGELDVIEQTIPKKHGGTTLVRVFAAEGKVNQGKFALEVACKTLPLYEDFFGSDYVLPKADLLAIPDFAAGAMENWGLITYRETALLCDESSSAVHRQWVALVVAHELAHQWFGNLVTMDWWKELWLNESFATWVEYWAVDQLFPSWQIFTQFVNDETGRAMELDALKSSHPVEVDLANAHEIDDIFDAISYSKGGSVLRMAVEFIGMDAFKTGLVNYLDHFKFGNATTKDLWDFLGKAANKDLTGILDSWILKQGYPMLTVNRVDAETIEIVQERFLSSGKASAEDDTTVWEIPLLLRTSASNDEVRLVLKDKVNKVSVPAGATWVKVNSRQAAFCRVMYDDTLRAQLTEAIKSKAISNLDRLGMIADYHAFAKGGHGTAVEALKLAEAYVAEDDYTVWCALSNLLGDIKSMLRTADEPARDAFNAWIAKLVTPALERIGYTPKEGDHHRDAQLRALLLATLASAKAPKAIEAVREMWKNREVTSIPADLRGAVYNTEIREGGQTAVDSFKKMYEESTDAMERARALRSLGACPDPETLKVSIFPWVMSSAVRSQDAVYFIAAVSANSKAEDLIVDIFINQWKELFAKFPGMLLGRFVKGIDNFYNIDHIAKLETFWATVDSKERETVERSFQQGVEGIRVNAAFAARNKDVLAFISK